MTTFVVFSRFASKLMGVTETEPESWVAMGYYCLASRKATRAVYFAQKVKISYTWPYK